MHTGIMEWGTQVLTPELVEGKRVLEVGSLDVNGSLQDHIKSMSPAEFMGIDIQDGPGVDEVLDVAWLLARFGPRRWDLVVCLEMLEHCLAWEDAIYQMKDSLAIDGWLVLSTRSPGFAYHEHPHDYWRFTPEVMTQALNDLDHLQVIDDPGVNIGIVHSDQSGVFAVGQREGEVHKPHVSAEPAPPPGEVEFVTFLVWPELEEILQRATQAVLGGEDPEIVRQAFARFERAISQTPTRHAE